MSIPIKSPEEIQRMRAAGRVLWSILEGVLAACRPGTTSAALDAEARRRIAAAGAVPLLDGYSQAGAPPFPGTACICVNEEAVHAPPSPRLLRAGDIVTVDIAIQFDGWCVDAARSTIVAGGPDAPPGASPDAVQRLLDAAVRAVEAGVRAMLPGAKWSSVAAEMEAVASASGLVMIPGYCGHGIGRALHEPPRAWSIRSPRLANMEPDFILRPGMVLTIEPILTTGHPAVITLDDGWTVLAAERAPVCHEERTVAVTRSGPELLTAPRDPAGL